MHLVISVKVSTRSWFLDPVLCCCSNVLFTGIIDHISCLSTSLLSRHILKRAIDVEEECLLHYGRYIRRHRSPHLRAIQSLHVNVPRGRVRDVAACTFAILQVFVFLTLVWRVPPRWMRRVACCGGTGRLRVRDWALSSTGLVDLADEAGCASCCTGTSLWGPASLPRMECFIFIYFVYSVTGTESKSLNIFLNNALIGPPLLIVPSISVLEQPPAGEYR